MRVRLYLSQTRKVMFAIAGTRPLTGKLLYGTDGQTLHGVELLPTDSSDNEVAGAQRFSFRHPVTEVVVTVLLEAEQAVLDDVTRLGLIDNDLDLATSGYDVLMHYFATPGSTWRFRHNDGSGRLVEIHKESDNRYHLYVNGQPQHIIVQYAADDGAWVIGSGCDSYRLSATGATCNGQPLSLAVAGTA